MLASKCFLVVVGMLQQEVCIPISILSSCQLASLLMCQEMAPTRRGSPGTMSCCAHGGSSSRHVREGPVFAALSIRRVFEAGSTAEPVDSKPDASDEIWNWCASVHDSRSRAL